MPMSSGPAGRLPDDSGSESWEEPVASSRKLFVNLAVDDLARSVEFFGGLGFTFDPRFTDETATCMVVSDEAFVMLLVRDRFQEFTQKELCEPATHTEAILALSAESREAVDELADLALASGGSPANEPLDHGFMYGRSFHDPDGHLWEPIWMDPAAVEAGPAAVETT
jgi:predicted lactoylglutathione lyase